MAQQKSLSFSLLRAAQQIIGPNNAQIINPFTNFFQHFTIYYFATFKQARSTCSS
jgi:hypothetical protein